MKLKTVLMDEDAIRRSIIRISHEIIERNKGADNLIIIGIYRRGVPLAKEIVKNIEKFEKVTVPMETMDITFYRDDLTKVGEVPAINKQIKIDVTDKTVILTDDVIYTGRTVRAALDGIFEHGRPKAIQLAVLIDRGHRELPIRPDFIGKNIPTSNSEVIAVNLPEYDNKFSVEVYE